MKKTRKLELDLLVVKLVSRYCIILIFLIFSISSIPLANSEQNECSHSSEMECSHYPSVGSTDSFETIDIAEFEISGDGDSIIYTDSEMYHLIHLDSQKEHSDYLMPGESIGLDGYTGELMVISNEGCFFVRVTSHVCELNNISNISENKDPPENHQGSYYSKGYIVCDLEHPNWFSTYCDKYDPLRVDEYYRADVVYSPNGQYELWFSSYLVDEDMFTDDYDGIVGYGEVINWEIQYENESVKKSVTRVTGGYSIQSSSKDDVYGMVWSHDSKYAYIITCQEIHGIDPRDNTKSVLDDNPVSCDTEGDSYNDEVGYTPKDVKISMDGSTLAYIHGEKLVLIHLVEESESGSWIFLTVISASVVIVGYIGYKVYIRGDSQ